MFNKIRALLKIEFIVPALIIIFAFTGALGILPVNFEQMVLTILGFLAIDALVERTTFFNNLKGEVNKLGTRKVLRSRLEPDYKDFNTYCRGAQDVFLCGLSLGFVTIQQRFYFEDRLRNGCDFRLLIVDPDLSDDAFQLIAEHDERFNGPEFIQFLRSELRTSLMILHGLCDIPGRTGHIEVRATKGLPAFTITMVDPSQESGKMRIELRPYKRNQGARPYFELKRRESEDRYWYDFFMQQYYIKLWEESKVIAQY
jgi:hypothetical protein